MIDVALCPAEIRRYSQTDLSSTVAVVFDVLRATSTIVTGLQHGVSEFHPVSTVAEAFQFRENRPEFILAGERSGLRIDGFQLGNSPAEFLNLAGKKIVTTTTNGTVALNLVNRARVVLVAALINLEATGRLLADLRPEQILLVCAGTGDSFSFEDAISAGALVELLGDSMVTTDAARMVLTAWQQVKKDVPGALRGSSNGRALFRIGKANDVEDCARISVYDTVGQLSNGSVVALPAHRPAPKTA